MKIKNFALMCLLASSAYANTTPNNIDSIKNTILNDGKNAHFVIKLTNIDTQNWLEDSSGDNAGTRAVNTLYGTVGAMLLPNTWKINISYTGTIGENVLYEDSDYNNPKWTNTAYTYDEGETDAKWLKFYTKPLSTKIGDFGFGYTSIEKSNTHDIWGLKAVDISTTDINGIVRYKVKTDRVNFTYNIPSNNSKWYSGFGFSYGYETSNRAKAREDGNIVLKPDTTTNILTVGINKTLDEVQNGFSFKTLSFGISDSEHKYYDKTTSSNKSFSTSGEIIDIDAIYMFKPSKNKQFYLSSGILLKDDDGSGGEEIKLELGLLF